MNQPDKRVAESACRKLLKPIVSLLLKCGMTWREFAAIGRFTFVQVASDEYGIAGRPTNISRVSILTGIGRKDVKRLRDELEQPKAPLADKATGATAVLSGWFQDSDFLDADGKPRPLNPGAGKGTFLELCERYAGDIPAGAMQKELLRTGAIEERDGRLMVLSRYYMPTQADPQWLQSAAGFFADLGHNVNYNFDAGEKKPSRFLGRSTNTQLSAADVNEFRAFLEEKGQAFLEEVDDWLTAHARDGQIEEQQVRLGVGLFTIEGDSHEN